MCLRDGTCESGVQPAQERIAARDSWQECRSTLVASRRTRGTRAQCCAARLEEPRSARSQRTSGFRKYFPPRQACEPCAQKENRSWLRDAPTSPTSPATIGATPLSLLSKDGHAEESV